MGENHRKIWNFKLKYFHFKNKIYNEQKITKLLRDIISGFSYGIYVFD